MAVPLDFDGDRQPKLWVVTKQDDDLKRWQNC